MEKLHTDEHQLHIITESDIAAAQEANAPSTSISSIAPRVNFSSHVSSSSSLQTATDEPVTAGMIISRVVCLFNHFYFVGTLLVSRDVLS